MTEADIQADIMIEATRLGHRLMRNNVGVARYKRDGREYAVPYGVGGEGGSDLIGLTRVKALVGNKSMELAVFTVVEVKSQRGRVTPEQQQFIDAIRASGGLAAVCRSVEAYRALVGAK